MNTIIPINRNGIFLLLAALLVISAGCIADQPQANATPARPAADTSSSQTPGTVTSPFQATITPTITATPSPAANLAMFSDHGSVNVLRGKPFTITGTVPDKTMTTVQVWLLNRSVTTMLVPVQPDGTFSVTLDAGTTAALSRNFTSAIIAQYPAPPDRFAVNYDPASGQITASSAVPDRILKGVNDEQYYPTTQQDYLCQAIDSPGTNNSCTVTFLNGVDAWIDIAPIPPGPPGTMTVSGTTSLPAGTSAWNRCRHGQYASDAQRVRFLPRIRKRLRSRHRGNGRDQPVYRHGRHVPAQHGQVLCQSIHGRR